MQDLASINAKPQESTRIVVLLFDIFCQQVHIRFPSDEAFQIPKLARYPL
jgi:hypothetical protein